uniref:Uncharacterized protein n=1 Tax=Glossina pallidipes TaxID=7398 RepID=A0A1A9Z774_GLOPL
MSSGRSARLPPTPNAPNNKQWAATNNATVSSSSSALLSTASGSLREPNSNNVMNSYNISNSITTRINMTPIIGISGGAVVGDGGSVDVDGGGGLINRVDAATEGIPGETIDALGPELAVATSQVLENLTENERKMIIEVLNRDENVRQRDATRIMEIVVVSILKRSDIIFFFIFVTIAPSGGLSYVHEGIEFHLDRTIPDSYTLKGFRRIRESETFFGAENIFRMSREDDISTKNYVVAFKELKHNQESGFS